MYFTRSQKEQHTHHHTITTTINNTPGSVQYNTIQPLDTGCNGGGHTSHMHKACGHTSVSPLAPLPLYPRAGVCASPHEGRANTASAGSQPPLQTYCDPPSSAAKRAPPPDSPSAGVGAGPHEGWANTPTAGTQQLTKPTTTAHPTKRHG
jgi:hypothetical protein